CQEKSPGRRPKPRRCPANSRAPIRSRAAPRIIRSLGRELMGVRGTATKVVTPAERGKARSERGLEPDKKRAPAEAILAGAPAPGEALAGYSITRNSMRRFFC